MYFSRAAKREVGVINTFTVEASTEELLDVTEKALISVLYVDDESLFKVVKQCLEMEDLFQVETAVSAEEAMKKLKEKMYDVVVFDYQLPEKDGLQFLKELREKGYNIPFIILTRKDKEEEAIRTLNLGVDKNINKVGDPETVYSKLAQRIIIAVKSRHPEEALLDFKERYRGLFRVRANWSDALIYASGFSYIAAAVATLGGYPALDPGFLPTWLQITFYLVMPLLLAVSQLSKPLRGVLAAIYGMVAMLSFSGVQPWVNYHGDSSLLGPAMAAWDLALAVALLHSTKTVSER